MMKKIVFDKFASFLLSQLLDHCNAYLVSIVFHFSLEGWTLALMATFPCHFLSLTLYNVSGQLRF